MRIALAQRNLDKAYDYLHEVSHPVSGKFGQHWSAKQVAETFAPRYADQEITKIKADPIIVQRLLILSSRG